MSFDIWREFHADTTDRSGLSASDAAVLQAIIWHADDATRRCWPSNATLADRAGLTDRAVRKVLVRLQPDWVKVHDRGGSNRYIEVVGTFPTRNEVPGQPGTVFLPTRNEVPPNPEHGSGTRNEGPGNPERGSTEPVRNQSENQSLNPSMNLGALRARGSLTVVKTQPQTISDVVNYFRANLQAVCREKEIPLPGGFNTRNFATSLSRVKSQCQVDIPTLVAMVDLYLDRPGTWARDKHPAWDFVSANTVARLRNRLGAASVDVEEPPAAPATLSMAQQELLKLSRRGKR